MTEVPDLPASRGSMRDEAADWFAVMRGPDAEARRAEFEAWLDAQAIHREAYNRIAETFSLGKALKGAGLDEQISEPAPPAGKSKVARPAWAAALLLIAAAAAMTWGVIRQNQAFAPRPQLAAADSSKQQLTTRVGEIRKFRMADGSVATLDTDSLILVSYDAGSRDLTLARGRARFEVVHDGRPFVVAAESGSVTAVGTVFDVALGAHGRVDVRLLKGAVDVTTASRSASTVGVSRLSAGEVMSFGGTAAPVLTKMSAMADADWPAGLRSFNGVRLADVLADGNRYGTLSLRTDEPGVADLRISGTFRVDNPRQLASNIAEVLGLVQMAEGNEIVLTRSCRASTKETSAKENCVPPS